MATSLNSKQQKAVMSLASGNNITTVANEIKVARSTIYDWLKNNETFIAALNQLRKDNLDAVQVQIQAAATTAIQTLIDLMQGEHSGVVKIQAAKEILSMCGFAKDSKELYGKGIGLTTAQEVAQDIATTKMLDAMHKTLLQ